MRIATIRHEGGTRAAVVHEDSLAVLDIADVGVWLEAGSPDWTRHDTGIRIAIEAADFAPVVPRPGKIVCVGLNYREHIREMGRDLPEFPTLFAKYADALIGAQDDIVLPPGSAAVDWEAELAVIVGGTVSRADDAAAREAIAGFTVANDVSARDFQRRTLQWLQGKTFDDTTPLGPFLVTADETGVDPDLELSCRVDGVSRQRARTSDLVFGPTALVQYISAITTLRPGDVILTGTPGGVGDGRDPQEFLHAGSELITTIEHLGETRNTCVTRAVSIDARETRKPHVQ